MSTRYYLRISLCLWSICVLWEGSAALQCFKCIHVPYKSSSEASCSDPWPWYREIFGKSSMPRRVECDYSCMKILLGNPEHGPTVVRTCTDKCVESVTDSTITTCCDTDFCNHGKSISTNTSRILIISTLFIGYITKQGFG